MKKNNFILSSILIVFAMIFSLIWGTIFAQDAVVPTIPLAPSDLILDGNPKTTTTTNTTTNLGTGSSSTIPIAPTTTTITPTNTTTQTNTTTVTPTTTSTIVKPTTTTQTNTTSTTTIIKPTTTNPVVTTPTITNSIPTNITAIPNPTNPNIAPIPAVPIVTKFSIKIQNLGVMVEERKIAVGDSKDQLTQIINESVANIVDNNINPLDKTVENKINNLRDELLKRVDSSLATLTTITSADINKLKTDVSGGLNDIKTVAGDNITPATSDSSLKDVNATLTSLSETVSDQASVLKNTGADLLYKDSNKDGISDYDATYVYNMNPRAPAILSSYEGKTINAGEKVLLGFDPTKTEIVKVEKQDPVVALTPVVDTYKVKEVALTSKKEVVLRGQALPNSFITIYIYSTPIIVTVKTDSNGEWKYTLDKELENGDHTVYTASVNNSGNIVAKSNPFLFTKTAEAASLKDTAFAQSPTDTSKPSLLQSNNIFAQVIVFIIIVILLISLLVIIGMPSKKSKDVVS